MAEVQILSMMFVKPASPTPQKHQTYNLSFFDLLTTHSFFDLLTTQVYVPYIYFYPFNPSSSTRIQEVLKKSLSETLSLYPPMAGRLKEDGLSISCQDQGVVFFEAQANAQLAEFLSKVYKDLSLLDAFFPQDIGEATSVEAPFLAVQATTFLCGGLALAIHCSHALVDGVSGTTFLTHWATVTRLPGNYASNLILQDFHMPLLFPTNISELMPPKRSFLIDTDKIVGKVFVFDGDAISAIKAKVVASSDWGVKKYYHIPSRVAVVTASIWKALISISQAKHGYLRPSVLSFTFNFRGRTSSPVQIPKDSFGNCFVPVVIRFPANKTDHEVKLHDLVGLVWDTIQATILAFSKASTHEEIISLAVKLHSEFITAMNNEEEEEDIHEFSSWCKFPFYDIDFGWGTPSWFGTRLPFKLVVLTDTKCGNGIEAKVGLNETDMLKFEGDPDIKAFNSTSSVEIY